VTVATSRDPRSFYRRALRALSYGVLFLTIWFLWPRELDGSNPGQRKTAVPDYAMVNAHYVSVKAGHLEVETHAKEASFNLTTHQMMASNVVSLIYNAKEERTIVTADRAQFLMDQRVLHLNDHVQSLAPDGFLMKTQEATYTMGKRLLTTSTPVEGRTFEKEVQVWGDRAESALDENKVHLLGNARAVYNEPKHGETRMRGDTAVLDRTEEKATFVKNVKVEQKDITGTSDTGDLYYSSHEKGIRYLSLNTDVVIAQPDGKHTRSQEAEFFAPTDSIVLTGFPSVYDGDDVLTGDKITVYRATGVVEVTATNAAGAQVRDRDKTKKGEAPTLNKEDEELIP
jgi:LPS export ABC transporter protein LptC